MKIRKHKLSITSKHYYSGTICSVVMIVIVQHLKDRIKNSSIQ